MEERIGRPKKNPGNGGIRPCPAVASNDGGYFFDQEVVVPESFESSCLGAAVLGLYAIGECDSLDIVSTMVGATHEHKPIKAHAEIYHQLLPIYIQISRKMAEEYEAIARFQLKLF